MKCSRCDKEVISKGLCTTHYRAEKVRLREAALKDIINKAEDIAKRRPDLAPTLAELTRDAKTLFREFTPKKLSPSDEIKALREEMAELKASLGKPSNKQSRSKT